MSKDRKSSPLSGESYDVLVIGAGPGGYVCALELSRLGLSVACIDDNVALGGTCLNTGCIPSKALLNTSHLYHQAKNMGQFGIDNPSISFDLSRIMAFKDQVVMESNNGIAFLLKKAKIAVIKGTASFKDAKTLHVVDDKKEHVLKAKRAIVIATGSESISLPQCPFDGKKIISSTQALSLPSLPKFMVVVGGGYIGLEIGSIWSRLGTKVTIVEMGEHIAQGMDREIAKHLQTVLTTQNINIDTGSKVGKVKKTRNKILVDITVDGKSTLLEPDVLLVAIGRKPLTHSLNLASISLAQDARGYIVVDKHGCTNVTGVYAIGDVCGGALLAHKASSEANVVAHVIAGKAPPVKTLIPGVIYTHPEVASVGATEEDLIAQDKKFHKGIFPLMASGRAKSTGEKHGLCKVLTDEDDRLLGAHIMAPSAGEMIMECATTMAFGGSAEDLASICHPHPTLSESISEASRAAWTGKALHSL